MPREKAYKIHIAENGIQVRVAGQTSFEDLLRAAQQPGPEQLEPTLEPHSSEHTEIGKIALLENINTN